MQARVGCSADAFELQRANSNAEIVAVVGVVVVVVEDAKRFKFRFMCRDSRVGTRGEGNAKF